VNEKILCVDDDANILDAYRRSLRKQFTIEVALGGEQGLTVLKQSGPFAVVVSDMQMPGMNGIEFLSKCRTVAPETVRMMLTGNADLKTSIDALNEGSIFRFLVKPVPPEKMGVFLQQGVEQYRLITSEKELLEKTLRGAVKILVEILSAVNPELFGRSQQLRQNMRILGDALGLTDSWSIELAAMLAQIGLVSLPPTLFQRIDKGVTLSPSEQAMFDRAPEISYNLLANIPRLENVAKAIRYQNKNFDGSGAPADNISGDEIPLPARMLKVLLDWKQFESKGVPRAALLPMMRARRGWYDPRVLEAAARACGVKNEQPSLPIRLGQLKVGDVLVSNMETEDGKLLIASGHSITPPLLEKIKNYSAFCVIKEPFLIQKSADGFETRRAA